MSEQCKVPRQKEAIAQPLAPIAIISEQLDSNFSDSVNYHLRNRRNVIAQQQQCLADTVGYLRSDYRIPVDLTRFTSGEGKAYVKDSVRGHDVFIICDVLNHGKFITRFNRMSSLSPDDHFMDVVRIISAIHGTAKRVNVVLPYLYESRRYQRTNRGSLDCAVMLKYLFEMGVSNVLTFDAHDPRVKNAVPGKNFESVSTSFQIIEAILDHYDDLALDSDHLVVVSPDETTVSRCIYYASMLKVPLGIFYRRRQFNSQLGIYDENEKRYLGDSLEGKDVLLIDDMIDTGNTMVSCAKALKEKGAKRIICAASFAQFTKGFEHINQAHEEGCIERVFATNMCFRSEALLAANWYTDVSISRYLALILDSLNCDSSLSALLDPTERIKRRIQEYGKQ